LSTSLKRRVKALYQGPAVEAARAYRRCLRSTRVVGITGSCGKTTAKDLTAAVLLSRLSGRKSYDTTNGAYSIARTLLATRPWDDFCVQEVGAFAPGNIDRPLAVLRPNIGVITVIGDDHYSSFRGAEGVALEKRKLVDILPAHGIAVLNLDDPHLAAIARTVKVRVVSFGRAQDADVRAEDISAAYPERLSFSVCHAGERVRVRSRLLGEHQLPSVLAAFAVGAAAGVSLADAARAIEACEPTPGRMEPIVHADGVTFINDSYKASYWTLDVLFDFMRSARAGRKWIVLGKITHHGLRSRQLYRRVAERALACCDRVVFVGPSAHHAPEADGRVRAFAHVREADALLRAELRPGDLVLVKGDNVVDHLARLFLSRVGTVSCWREDCRLAVDCRSCRMLAR